MTNLFVNAQEAENSKSFLYNDLNGLNTKGSGYSKIEINGQIDEFTAKTLYENYDVIARNLKVYPTIKIYPRGYKLDGGFGGFYRSDRNHIDIVDNYYLITLISHKMRHAYQYIYFPDLFFEAEYNSVRGYLNCSIERDARAYSVDYCAVRNYWEELNFLREDERQIELFIKNQNLPSILGLNEGYFRENPSVARNVPRNYHLAGGLEKNLLRNLKAAGRKEVGH